MSAYFERYRNEYFDRMFRVSAEGDWESWFEYCLRGTVAQANDSIIRCDLLGSLRKKYYDLLSGGGSNRDHATVTELFRRPLITVPQLMKIYGVTYPTAKADINRLVDLGILVKLPNTRPKTYYAHKIFHIVYSENPGQTEG